MFDYSYISTFKKEGAYNGKRLQINQTVLGRRKKREEIIEKEKGRIREEEEGRREK